jgi:hypothetical protein
MPGRASRSARRTAVLTFGHVGGLDIAGLLYAAALTIIGYQALWFGC